MLSGDNFSSLANEDETRRDEMRIESTERASVESRTSSTIFSRVTAMRGFPVFLSLILLKAIAGSAVSIFITVARSCEYVRSSSASVLAPLAF